MARPLIVNHEICIPAEELSLTFARSSGPGGQNVNKVNSKAVLKWHVAASSSLSEQVKSRFFQRFGQRVNQAGELVISSDRFRDQPQNISECYERLRQLIQAVLVVPRKRVKTRPSKAAVQQRLANKRRRSDKKKSRQFRADADD